jgi:uncharacterized membrane protein
LLPEPETTWLILSCTVPYYFTTIGMLYMRKKYLFQDVQSVLVGCPPAFLLKRIYAKSCQVRGSEIAKASVCFATFSHNSKKVTHRQKRKNRKNRKSNKKKANKKESNTKKS